VIVVRIITSFLALRILQPALLQCMRIMSSSEAVQEKVRENVSSYSLGHEFITPDPAANPFVINAAKTEMDRLFEQEPQTAQATLNACMESLRPEPLFSSLTNLMGGLMAKGYHPQEAILRTWANVLMLGIIVGRKET
jgi:hypothetical protein